MESFLSFASIILFPVSWGSLRVSPSPAPPSPPKQLTVSATARALWKPSSTQNQALSKLPSSTQNASPPHPRRVPLLHNGLSSLVHHTGPISRHGRVEPWKQVRARHLETGVRLPARSGSFPVQVLYSEHPDLSSTDLLASRSTFCVF